MVGSMFYQTNGLVLFFTDVLFRFESGQSETGRNVYRKLVLLHHIRMAAALGSDLMTKVSFIDKYLYSKIKCSSEHTFDVFRFLVTARLRRL